MRNASASPLSRLQSPAYPHQVSESQKEPLHKRVGQTAARCRYEQVRLLQFLSNEVFDRFIHQAPLTHDIESQVRGSRTSKIVGRPHPQE